MVGQSHGHMRIEQAQQIEAAAKTHRFLKRRESEYPNRDSATRIKNAPDG
jgi:hypothetical protein